MKKKTKTKAKGKNKKKIIIVVAITLIVLIAGILCFIKLNEKTKSNVTYKEIKFKEEKEEMIFNSYQEYKENLDDNSLTEKDFEDSKYVLLKIIFDPCSESLEGVSDVKISSNKVTVTIDVNVRCGGCAPDTKYYLVKVDKDTVDENSKIVLKYNYLNKVKCPTDVAYKPIIYLYPEKEMDVSVKLSNEKNITHSYPKYNNGWNVTATPNGDLINKDNNKKLYSLYWEGKNLKTEVKEDGFVVEGKNVAEFLEEKLDILGLNYKEKEEFIIYWLPKLENNKYNYIRFLTEEEIDNYMKLNITPKPNTLIRVYMSYKPIKERIDIRKQILNKKVRNGFTVVEWEGTKIN